MFFKYENRTEFMQPLTEKFYLETKSEDLDSSFLENYIYKCTYYETKYKAMENLDVIGSDLILDVGCGQGHLLKLICDKYPNVKAIGVDLSLFDIRKAKKRNLNQCEFIICDVSYLPLSDCYFDRVICTAVLEHVTDEKKVLNEIWRVLKEGQIAVLDVPGKYHLKNRFSDFLVKKFRLAPFHREYSFKEIESIINETGFELQAFNTARFIGSLLFPVIETIYISKSRRIVWCKGFLAKLICKVGKHITSFCGNRKYLKLLGGSWFLKIEKVSI